MPQKSVSDFKPTGIAIDHRYYSDRDIQAIISAAGGLPQGKVEHESASKDGKRLITKTVERQKALEARLERAAQTWAVDAQFPTKPTDTELSGSFAAIEAAAGKLLKALQLSPQPDPSDPLAPMPAALRFDIHKPARRRKGGFDWDQEADRLGGFPEWTGDGLLAECVRGVYRLRDWARDEAIRIKPKKPTPHTERHGAAAALNELIESLVSIWVEIFEQKTRTSVGAPGTANEGQAIGPLVRFLKTCLKPLLQDSVPSEDAIRSRVRRLPT